MKIAMIGLGRMGHPMAKHMHAAGHDLACFDIAVDARRRAAAAGLPVVETIEAIAGSEVVCSSLPATEHVEAAYDAVFDIVGPGTVCADLSTIAVGASRRLAESASARSIGFLDTPVSGTSIHAESGTLVVMAGGNATDLETARPALECFATRVEHVGDNGAGLLLKLVTNRLLTTHLAAIAEAVLDLEAVGLDVEQSLAIIGAGAVTKLFDYKLEPLVNRDFSPAFTVDLMRKDLRLAATALPDARLGEVGRQLLEETAEAGHGDEDLAALITALEKGRR